MSLKKEEYRFDDMLWNYIKTFLLYRGCGLYFGSYSCANPGTQIYYAQMKPGIVEFSYVCLSCFTKIFDRKEKEDEVYYAIRNEVSTKVVGIAALRSKIKAMSNKNLLRVLSIPPTYRNMRPLRKTRSHVLLYKIPAEETKKRSRLE